MIIPMLLAAAILWMPGLAHAQTAPTLVERYDLERRGGRFDLPDRLDEVSGLAFTPDGRLFAHDDERARIHEIDVDAEEVGKRFSLGDPPEPGDFEAMEIIGERFFIMTSTGLLYETREAPEDRAVVPFRAVDTGLGRVCEAEGLAYDAQTDELLVACKVSSPPAATVVIQRLPVTPGQRRPPPIEVPLAALEALGFGSEFHASAIAVDPVTGTLVLLAAREEIILEVERDGRVLSAFQLSRNRHPQPEGIAFGPDGTLYIADEAAGRERGRITYYHPRVEEPNGLAGGRP